MAQGFAQSRCGTRLIRLCLFAAMLACLAAAAGTHPVQANSGQPLHRVRTIYPSEWGVPHPAGLVYDEGSSLFLLANRYAVREQAGEGMPGTTVLVAVTPYQEFVASVPLALLLRNAATMAVDSRARLLYVLDPDTRLAQVPLAENGLPGLGAWSWHNLAALRPGDVRGMAIDPLGQALYLLDGAAPAILRVPLGEHEAVEVGGVARLPLAYLGTGDLRGLGVHPVTGHLFVLSQAQQSIYEISPSGRLLAQRSIASLDLRDPQGIVVAASPDLTDSPDVMHLFIADSNLPSRAPGAPGLGQPSAPPYGAIVEAALVLPEGFPTHRGPISR